MTRIITYYHYEASQDFQLKTRNMRIFRFHFLLTDIMAIISNHRKKKNASCSDFDTLKKVWNFWIIIDCLVFY